MRPRLLDLAEARWRTGDLARAGESADRALEGGVDDPLALVIAAEAAAARGRHAEADDLAGRALEDLGTTLDALFAGMPRSAVWPGDPRAAMAPVPAADADADADAGEAGEDADAGEAGVAVPVTAAMPAEVPVTADVPAELSPEAPVPVTAEVSSEVNASVALEALGGWSRRAGDG